MSRVKYVCSRCGSEDILFDAYAVWNTETQEMELVNTFDKGHFCNECGGECSVKEVELEESDPAEDKAAEALDDPVATATEDSQGTLICTTAREMPDGSLHIDL